jgi:hypothetical protein
VRRQVTQHCCYPISSAHLCCRVAAGAVLPSAGQLALAVAVAAGVTGARAALLSVWPEFKDASDRSNKQVTAPHSHGLHALPVHTLAGAASPSCQ